MVRLRSVWFRPPFFTLPLCSAPEASWTSPVSVTPPDSTLQSIVQQKKDRALEQRKRVAEVTRTSSRSELWMEKEVVVARKRL